MKYLNSEKAKKCAELHVSKKYDPANSSGYFNYYFVRVGEDESHQPDPIYAEDLPENILLVNGSRAAVKIFVEKCDFRNEYLVKVSVNLKTMELSSEILMDLPAR